MIAAKDRRHDLLCRGSDCHGLYDEFCGDDRCNGCVPTHCPCWCHAADSPCQACGWTYKERA